ncbi:MAG: vWA domain-containing protein [Verrucomicrobiota bacterium]
MDTPLIVSVIAHVLLFLMVGTVVIFEKPMIQNHFELGELGVSLSQDKLVEDELLFEEIETLSLEVPTEMQEVDNPTVGSPNVSAIADVITSMSSINLSHRVFVPENTAFAFDSIAKGIGYGLGEGSGLGNGVGRGAGRLSSKVSFFGVQAEGVNIQFIIDLSASMRGPKIERLRSEMIKAISSLENGSQVSIICFAGRGWVWGTPYQTFVATNERGSRIVRKDWTSPKPKWIPIDEFSRAELLSQAKEISYSKTIYGTNWTEAVDLAKRVSPNPSAVFFMTDGRHNGSNLSEFNHSVADWSENGFPFNIVFLGNNLPERGEKSLTAAAKSSNGIFKMVRD